MSGPGDSQEVRLMIGAAWTVWGETPSRALIIVYSVRMFAVPLVVDARKEWPCGVAFPEAHACHMWWWCCRSFTVFALSNLNYLKVNR